MSTLEEISDQALALCRLIEAIPVCCVEQTAASEAASKLWRALLQARSLEPRAPVPPNPAQSLPACPSCGACPACGSVPVKVAYYPYPVYPVITPYYPSPVYPVITPFVILPTVWIGPMTGTCASDNFTGKPI